MKLKEVFLNSPTLIGGTLYNSNQMVHSKNHIGRVCVWAQISIIAGSCVKITSIFCQFFWVAIDEIESTNGYGAQWL